MPPYAFVTNGAGPFEIISQNTAVSSNAISMIEHTFDYNINMVVNEKDSRTAETLLDDLQKILMETLEADYNLNSTVDESFFVRVDELRVPGAELGKGFRGRVITLRCRKVTA